MRQMFAGATNYVVIFRQAGSVSQGATCTYWKAPKLVASHGRPSGRGVASQTLRPSPPAWLASWVGDGPYEVERLGP